MHAVPSCCCPCSMVHLSLSLSRSRSEHAVKRYIATVHDATRDCRGSFFHNSHVGPRTRQGIGAHRQLMAPADPFHTFPSSDLRPARRLLPLPLGSRVVCGRPPRRGRATRPLARPRRRRPTAGPHRRPGLAAVGIAAIALVAGAGGGYLAGGGTTTTSRHPVAPRHPARRLRRPVAERRRRARPAQRLGRVDRRRRSPSGRARSASRARRPAPASSTTADGYIVTNAHVVDGATSVTVTLAGETTARQATVISTDTEHDIAVLKVERHHRAEGRDVRRLVDARRR